MAVLSNGNIVTTFTDVGEQRADGDDQYFGIRARITAPDGSIVTPEFQVNVETEGVQSWPELASLGNGGFVIVWTDSLQGPPRCSGALV